MTINVSSAVLLKHLLPVYGVIVSKPVTPILSNFLFEVKEEGTVLYVTASDLQNTVVTELPVNASEDISICVPAKLLIDTLKNLPEQAITINIEVESFSIEISSDYGHYKLAGENAIDFPKIPTLSKADTFQIPADVLAAAVTYTMFCASNDTMRPAMTGVYMTVTDKNTTFVATDGHRLVRYRRDDLYSEEFLANLILPKKALAMLKATLPDESSAVNMSFNATSIFFQFGNIKLISRLIDEKYPDYEAVIPASNPNIMTVQRAELLSSLKRISIYSTSSHQVRLKITEDELHLSAEDIEFSNEAAESIKIEYDGDPMEIGFTATYLIEMLGNISSNIVDVQLMAPNKPGILIPKNQDENEDILMLIMPVMLSHYV